MLRTRGVFLRGLAACYLCAFSSLYVQWDGLFGVDGLEPAAGALSRGRSSGDSWYAKERPTLLHLAKPALGLSTDLTAELLMCIGMAVSFLAAIAPRTVFGTAPAFLLLQLCYLSLCTCQKRSLRRLVAAPGTIAWFFVGVKAGQLA